MLRSENQTIGYYQKLYHVTSNAHVRYESYILLYGAKGMVQFCLATDATKSHFLRYRLTTTIILHIKCMINM